MLAAGLAIAIHGAVAGGHTSSSTTSNSGAFAGQACRMASLAVQRIPISNPTGLDRLGLQFTNRSSSSCRLDGYPVIRFSDAKGTIPFLFRYLGKPHIMTVPKGHSTFSIFSKFRCDLPGGLRSATRTTVELPEDRGASASFTGGPGICKPGIPGEGRTVTVTPFESLRTAYRVSLIGNGMGP